MFLKVYGSQTSAEVVPKCVGSIASLTRRNRSPKLGNQPTVLVVTVKVQRVRSVRIRQVIVRCGCCRRRRRDRPIIGVIPHAAVVVGNSPAPRHWCHIRASARASSHGRVKAVKG